MKLSKLFFFFFLFSVSLTLVSSLSVNIPVPINYTEVNTNHSLTSDYATTSGSAAFWDELNTPADIAHNLLSNLAWSVSGHTIDEDIDMNDHTLSDISFLVLSGGGYLGDFDGALDIASNLTPYSTLTYSLGSGALRWLNLYVSNINAEFMEVFNLNVTQDLNVEGNFTGNQIYGGMNYHNYSGVVLPFDTASYYYSLFFTHTESLNGFSGNNIALGLNSSLTAQVSGMYQLIYFAVGSGQNNHEYHLVPFINDTYELEICEGMKKMSAGGDVNPMNGNCFVRLQAGNNVSLKIADYTGTGDGVYYGGNLNLVRVGN